MLQHFYKCRCANLDVKFYSFGKNLKLNWILVTEHC